jgi:hypothetical protein
LQFDGYGGYRLAAERGDVQLAFCWAHVRRRFYELAAARPALIASEAFVRLKTTSVVMVLGSGAPSARAEATRPSMSSNPGCAPSLS